MEFFCELPVHMFPRSATSRIVRVQLIRRVLFNLLLKIRVTICSSLPGTVSMYACCLGMIISSAPFTPWSRPYMARFSIFSRMYVPSLLPSSSLSTPKACKTRKEGNLLFLKAQFLAVVRIFLLPPAEY